MQEPDLPANESKRLEKLYELDLLDTYPEERFDRITRIAKELFQVKNVPEVEVQSITDRLKDNFSLSKEAFDKPFELTYSMGSHYFYPKSDDNIKKVLHDADQRMYLEKKKKQKTS